MTTRRRVFLCNAATTTIAASSTVKLHTLEYRTGQAAERNVKLGLNNFVRNVFHIPDRILDLLEIAAYVYAGDRFVTRGERDAVEFHSWARSMHFIIRVRDEGFWNQPIVAAQLSDALRFMTGDKEYTFEFQPGHSTPQEGLFDSKEFMLTAGEPTRVMLFSGGLDSLTGAVDCLRSSEENAFLVSHRSQPATNRTQNGLVTALQQRFPGRVKHYPFLCSLTNVRAVEETQRSRSFLFTSIAFAICGVLNLNEFYVYENGITGIHFRRRQDPMNARTSRTTHPLTLMRLESLFSTIQEKPVSIKNPLLWCTKTDVMRLLRNHESGDLISSAVSCGVRRTAKNGTHCGGCNQCVDRRFAAYAAELDEYDDATGIYSFDFLQQPIRNEAARTTINDYVRLARHLSEMREETFYDEMMNELVPLIEALPEDEDFSFSKAYDLCRRQGQQVNTAIRRMRGRHDDPFKPVEPGSFLDMCNNSTYRSGYINPDELKRKLLDIQPGKKDAKKYEMIVQEILSLLFDPDLTDPRDQVKTWDGREVIDITYKNNATQGFWYDVKTRYQCLIVVFELKNMRSLTNTEYNQISNRLDDKRGMLGILVAREMDDLDQGRAYRQTNNQGKVVLTLTDEDLCQMLDLVGEGGSATEYIADKHRTYIERA